MKKIFLALLLALSLNVATTQKSHAGIGIATGSIGLALSGLGVGGTGFFVSVGLKDGGISFALGVLWGLIMLDGENGQEISFGPLTQESIEELGLSNKEVSAFNNNLEEMSLVANQIASELTEESTVEDSKELWAQYSSAIDPVAFDVLNRLAK